MNYESDADTAAFLDLMCSNSFIPYITKPTKITNRSKTLIDNIFHNDIKNNAITGNLTISISDHLAQILIIANKIQTKISTNSNLYKRNFKNFDRENFLLDILGINWQKELKLTEKDVNLSMETFLHIINSILDRYAPLKKITRKHQEQQNKPWITNGIIKSINTKNKIYNKYCRAKNSQNKLLLHETFKRYRNMLTTLTKKSKQNHFNKYFANNKNNLQKTWSGIKSIINVSAPKTKIPEALELNGKTITNPAKIANSFNNFFGSIAQKIENNIITTHKSFTDYLKTPNEKSLFLTPTTANDIKNIINELNSKKTSGPGSIPTEILKLTNNIISKPLSEIINLSFESGIFPSILKCSKIIPIYKKGENTSINSYRPISQLSNISKIIEKLIHSRTYSFLNKYKCIYDLQFGFRNRHSTNHALIQITEKIRKAVDDNNFACGVFVDLQKAFDTVNHNILLQKLKYYGIRGTPLAWFTSFLQQRTQTVSINGDLSEKLTVTHGVPQGSVLGPLLFLLYINDLHLAIQHSVIHHFADDTNMLLVGKSLKKIKKYINHDMSLLCHWLKANKLSLNTSKTEIILFRSQHKQINKKLNFRLSGQKIKLSKSVKYLGLILDEYLTWESHINILKAKLSRSVGMLAKIRHYVPQETLKTIFFAIFNSHISYGAQIWSQETNYKSKCLSQLQDKAIRIINFKTRNDNVNSLYHLNNMLKLPDFVNLLNCMFVYDYLNSNIPTAFKNYFTPVIYASDTYHNLY